MKNDQRKKESLRSLLPTESRMRKKKKKKDTGASHWLRGAKAQKKKKKGSKTTQKKEGNNIKKLQPKKKKPKYRTRYSGEETRTPKAEVDLRAQGVDTGLWGGSSNETGEGPKWPSL